MMALTLDGVTFAYPGAPMPALRDCTFRAEAGAVTWLTGALGAGTTTALLVASGLAPRHTGGVLEGSVRALGVDPALRPAAHELGGRVALVLASPAAQLSGIAETVAQEVAFAPANLGWPAPRIHSAVAEALTRLQISHLAGRDPATLSGGEMQRTVLAATLVLRPDLWLLDEPASALDAAGRDVLHRLMREEAGRGAAVVVASEAADDLADVADQVIVLRSGHPVLLGPPNRVLREEPIWEAGAVGTSVAGLARAVGVPAPRPLTVPEGVALWSR